MRTTVATSLVFFSLIGAAEAGQIVPSGAIKVLNNVNQLKGIAGTAAFDEGPQAGNVPLNQYQPQGLIFQTGSFQAILPGVVQQGTAVGPAYWGNGQPNYWPLPIAGGGTHAGAGTFFTGVATFTLNITQIGLTACTNGTQYLTAWSKQGAMIGQVKWIPAGDAAFVGLDTMGVPIGMVAFGNDDVFAGQTYDIGGATNISDTWIWATGGCVSAADCNDNNACTTDSCDVATGTCGHANNALACNDGNACTQTDTCSNGVCVGSNLMTCVPFDSCHDVGVCNPNTGMCSNPPKNDGSTCDDGNLCTANDACLGGVCVGSGAKCAPPDSCHTAGVCDPATGQCSGFPVKPDGAGCTDSNSCTQMDSCLNGVCVGSSPVVCPALDSCHEVGVCNAATGQCDNVLKQDGASCDDGNPCTQTDTCTGGVCGGIPLTCPAADACHETPVCNPMNGQCEGKPKADGVSCNDGNPCTQIDICQKGTCTGNNPITCMAKDACHAVGTCDAITGTCSDPAAADGTPCPEGTCQAGVCKPDSMGTGGSAGTGGSGGSTTTTTGTGGSSGTTTTGSGGSDAVQVGGCGCGVASSREGGAAWLALGLILALRRRRSHARPST